MRDPRFRQDLTLSKKLIFYSVLHLKKSLPNNWIYLLKLRSIHKEKKTTVSETHTFFSVHSHRFIFCVRKSHNLFIHICSLYRIPWLAWIIYVLEITCVMLNGIYHFLTIFFPFITLDLHIVVNNNYTSWKKKTRDLLRKLCLPFMTHYVFIDRHKHPRRQFLASETFSWITILLSVITKSQFRFTWYAIDFGVVW